MVDFININHRLCFQEKLKTLYPSQKACTKHLAALYIITSGPIIYSKTNSRFSAEGCYINDFNEIDNTPKEVVHLIRLASNLFKGNQDGFLDSLIDETDEVSIFIAMNAIAIKNNEVGEWIE